MTTYFIPVIVSLMLVLSGCGILGSSDDDAREEVSMYTGQTTDYNVSVRITEKEGQCINRRITLERRPKLHTRPTVYRVVAHDDRCDDRINNLDFRDPNDRNRVDRSILLQDIWYAFYEVVPIEKHMGFGGL